MIKKVRLGVNVDHVATLRQARGTLYPDVVEAALLCEKAGAGGITAHLREDRRHIQDSDVYALKKQIAVPLNLEMANEPEIVAIALDLCPAEVCIVPEKRQELTTEGGLDAAGSKATLALTIAAMKGKDIEVSLFIDPDPDQIRTSVELGVPCIELHTGTYCDSVGDEADRELERLISGAELAHELGIKVNAGHGINLDNIDGIMKIPHLDTLNIGHSIIARAVFAGIEGAVREMLRRL
jgi:pyridoxine 5-phosphate synthase